MNRAAIMVTLQNIYRLTAAHLLVGPSASCAPALELKPNFDSVLSNKICADTLSVHPIAPFPTILHQQT
jgi:hypothetical protein